MGVLPREGCTRSGTRLRMRGISYSRLESQVYLLDQWPQHKLPFGDAGMRNLEPSLVVLMSLNLTRVEYDVVVEEDVEVDDSRAVAEGLLSAERLFD